MDKLVAKIDKYKIGSKEQDFRDFVFEDIKNHAKGFMVFSREKYNPNDEEEKKICDKLGNYIYKERYYYCEKISEDSRKPQIIFILFNPSNANPDSRDKTIDNCYHLVKDKYSKMEVLNVFSVRNPKVDKKYLLKDFNNKRNMDFIKEFLKKRRGYDIVLGWGYGKEKDYKDVIEQIRQIIKENHLKQYSIGINVKSEELLKFLAEKQQHPGNQSWSSYGGFEMSAVLRVIDED